MFQAPSLLPWLTARENVALGVDRVYPHASRAERGDIVDYYLARVGLGDAMDKRAAELSNGMKQRVGIARAFALSPKLLLLDEPFGMLDSLTRWELQEVLMEVWSRTQVTAICVTHDVDEAILLADRVVMMTNGPNARIGRIMEVDICRGRARAGRCSTIRATTNTGRSCCPSSTNSSTAPAAAQRRARRRREGALHERAARHRRQRHGRACGWSRSCTKRALGRYAIAVVGEEPRLAYNRVLLSSVLAQEVVARARSN